MQNKHMRTFALLPPLQWEACQQAAELRDSIPCCLSVPTHVGNWQHGEASAGDTGVMPSVGGGGFISVSVSGGSHRGEWPVESATCIVA